MGGELFVLLMVVVCGFAALLFSILAWRIKKDVFFYLGLVFTSVLVIYAAINYEHLLYQMLNDTLLFMIQMSFIGFPIFFLIQSKMNPENTSLDGSQSTGQVTEAYLDEVINAEDEEIDFESEMDLK